MTANLIHDEAASVSQQLVNLYQAEKVILFGSAVKTPELANDLDFLVLKSDIPSQGLERMRQVRNLITKRFAADFLILTPLEFEQRKKLNDPFILNIINNGKVLYG